MNKEKERLKALLVGKMLNNELDTLTIANVIDRVFQLGASTKEEAE